MTGTEKHPVLIDPASLAEALGSSRPPVLLDVRWTLAGPQRQDYLAGHVPGAMFLDLDADLAAAPGPLGRHPLPEPAALEQLWRRLGISADTLVVVYDAADSSVAARAWWLLRWSGHRGVRVLDGGYSAWRRGGFAVETGEVPAPTAGTLRVRPGAMPVVDIDGAARVAGDPTAGVLLDARAGRRFRGEIEPVDPVAGHIPGAVNLPVTDLVTEDGTFRTPAQIRARLAAAGVVEGVPAVASCGSGVTACQVILAGELVGLTTALYPGSYSGWCAAGRPVATGA